MRLNGLGAPDETTLVPLTTVDAVVADDKKEQQQRGYCFHCEKYGHYKAQCRRLRKETYYASKTSTTDTKQTDAAKPKCETCRNCTKLKSAGMEPMRQMTPGNANVSSPSQRTRLANNPYLPRCPKQKTEVAAPTLWGKSRREGVHHRRPPQIGTKKIFSQNVTKNQLRTGNVAGT